MKAIIGVALLAACAFGQVFDNTQGVKTQHWNPLLMTETIGMKSTGEWNTLSLQEVIQHPLFQVYYQLPLFRQHFTHPLFQVYLTTPQFQQFWTHPLFPTFFTNSALFYKYIYPIVYNNNNIQTPLVNPINTWFNKMYTPTVVNNYEDLIKQMLVGGTEEYTKGNLQGMNLDKIIKNIIVNKPEEFTEVKTEVKIPTPFPINQINKIMTEKMMEESPVETVVVKEDVVKDDLLKENFLKKFYLEKMMGKNVYPVNRFNKMTPEEVLQQKLEDLSMPARLRRNTNYVQIPTYNGYKNVKIPAYNVPMTQQVFYTNPTTSFGNTYTNIPYSQANTMGTPYTYTNTMGTPYTYTNTVGTPYTYTNTVGTPYMYTNTNTFGNTPSIYTTAGNTPVTYNTVRNVPFNYYPTQTVV